MTAFSQGQDPDCERSAGSRAPLALAGAAWKLSFHGPGLGLLLHQGSSHGCARELTCAHCAILDSSESFFSTF